ERVPADEHRLGPLGVPEPLEEPREADEGVCRPAVTADRLRDRVIGPVRERVAVNCHQRSGSRSGAGKAGTGAPGRLRRAYAAHNDASSSAIASITRSVATRAASAAGSVSRSVSSTGAPYRTRHGWSA